MKKHIKWLPLVCLVLAFACLGVTFSRYATVLTDSFNLSIKSASYILQYNIGQATMSGSTFFQKIADNQFQIIAEEPYLSGYQFDGWVKQGTASPIYKAGDIFTAGPGVNILDAVLHKHVTLPAVSTQEEIKSYTNNTDYFSQMNNHTGSEVYKNVVVTDNSLSFDLASESGYERVGIPLEYMSIGEKYTINFTFETTAYYSMFSAKDEFSWQVVSADVAKYKLQNGNLPIDEDSSDIQNPNGWWFMYDLEAVKLFNSINTPQGGTDGVPFKSNYSFTFVALQEHMYLLFEFSCGYDNSSSGRYNITNLVVNAASDNAPLSVYPHRPTTREELGLAPLPLDLPPEENSTQPIAVDPFSIDENIEWWMADVDMQLPVAGKDYGLVFAPCNGYALPEYIGVEIDGVGYHVKTDGTAAEGAPVFDPASSTLTIPASLITADTKLIKIAATAVLGSEYIVEENDTLSKIAAKYSVSVDALAAYNNIKDINMIVVGNLIKIPPAGYVIPTEQTTAPTEETTAPTEETTAPTEEATAPTEEATSSTEETTAPTEETTSHAEETTAPTEETQATAQEALI